MKGHMQDGKFHPHSEYKKGTRKSRDQNAKTMGTKIRKARNQDLVYAESNNRGQNIKVVGHGDDWMLLVDRNVVGRATTQKEIFEMYDKVNTHPETGSPHFFDPRAPRSFRERQKRDPHIKGKKLPKEVIQGAKDDLGGTDIEVERYNPKWKLYEVYVDSDRYYFFPDEESAIKFGRQSIRDTASEYIPEEGSPQRAEYINLSDDDLVEKIIEEQSGYGQRSELGAVAQSVAGYDGEYSELPQGWIAFRID